MKKDFVLDWRDGRVANALTNLGSGRVVDASGEPANLQWQASDRHVWRIFNGDSGVADRV